MAKSRQTQYNLNWKRKKIEEIGEEKFSEYMSNMNKANYYKRRIQNLEKERARNKVNQRTFRAKHRDTNLNYQKNYQAEYRKSLINGFCGSARNSLTQRLKRNEEIPEGKSVEHLIVLRIFANFFKEVGLLHENMTFHEKKHLRNIVNHPMNYIFIERGKNARKRNQTFQESSDLILWFDENFEELAGFYEYCEENRNKFNI